MNAMPLVGRAFGTAAYRHIERGFMKRNIGVADRTIRVAIGVSLLAVVALLDEPVRWFGLIGLVSLVTAVLGNCPLYSLFGLSTCPVSSARR